MKFEHTCPIHRGQIWHDTQTSRVPTAVQNINMHTMTQVSPTVSVTPIAGTLGLVEGLDQ